MKLINRLNKFAIFSVILVFFACFSAFSQVYSANTVGYINISLGSGLNAIANQLDFDGTGTNNLMTNILNNLENNSLTVYKWDINTVGFDTWQYTTHSGGGWTTTAGIVSYSDVTLNPGEGCFVSVSSPTNIVLTGNVLQGTRTNKLAGNNELDMVSSIFPLSNIVDSTNNGGLNWNDKGGGTTIVYIWNFPKQTWDIWQYSTRAGGGWVTNGTVSAVGPTIDVGTAFFVSSTQTNWVNSFIVE